MAVPTTTNRWVEHVEVSVETSAGSGLFIIDERLRADLVESLSDGNVAEAHVAVRTDADFTPADAQRHYHADRRMIVHAKDAVLFDGYPVVRRLEMATPKGGTVSRRNRGGFQLVLEHVAARLGRDGAAHVVGRFCRDASIADGMITDPAKWAGASALLSGLPCVFNMDGAGNCDPIPIEVADASGGIRRVHVFAEDSRADAIPWTYARVLRYLLHFFGRPSSPVDADDVMRCTDDLAETPPDGREALLDRDDLAYALLARPDTLVVEAVSLLEALVLVSAASGVHLSLFSRRQAQGVRTSWNVWTARSGKVRDLRLATDARDANGQPLYDTAATPAVDLFDDNNVSAVNVNWDDRRITSAAIVVGGVKRYEIQAELLPGWLPRDGLDNVDAGQRAAAKAQALADAQILAAGSAVTDDPWFRKYHRAGAGFSLDWDVGRRWVLNEAGAYGQASFARNAPFDTYAPFDFSTLWRGPWMRRRRRLLPISPSANDSERVIVEVSFDGGTLWSAVSSGYVVLPDECGIWFDVANVLSISPEEGGDTNLWYALIDQTFRVRVRAMVESDERLMIGSPISTAPSLLQNTRLFYAPRRFEFVRPLPVDTTSQTTESATGLLERDDTTHMQTLARIMTWAGGSAGVAGRAVIPWLDTQYDLGDRIVGIRGRGVHFAAERSPSARHACVIGKRYHLGPDRFETELLLGPADREADRADSGS
jgi:hypothetical protein